MATGLLVAACGGGGGGNGGGGGKTVIRFANWAAAEPNTKPGIEAMIKKFEEDNPDIRIKSEPISYTDIAHQVALEARSGNAPDVAELQGNYTFQLANAGALKPLDDIADSAYKQSIIPNELELGKIDGKLVAIPWTVAPFALWYNKKVLKKAGLPTEPPTTWDKLLSEARVIHKKMPKGVAFGSDTTNRTYGLDQNWPIMLSFGGKPFSGKTASADTAAMKRYLKFVRTIAKRGYTTPNTKGGDFRQPAASNQVAFTIDGPYVKGVAQSLNHASDKEFYATWGVAPLPSATGKHYSAPTDHQLVMFNRTDHQEAAWKFMKFLSSSQYAVLNYTLKYENSLPPLAQPSGKVAEKLDNPISKAFNNDVIPTVTRPEWGKGYSNAYSDVMAGVQRAMTSSRPIDSIASQMQSSVQSDLGG